MNCPKADKLSQYTDYLLTEEEHSQIESHLKSCDTCTNIVQLFEEENQFVQDTLLSPALPDDFASLVLDQLEPYEQKKVQRKKQTWKHVLILAAGIVLALSLTATLNPAFAQFIGGMFNTKQVDEGLKMASDEGLSERVNLQVSDQDLTLKVEDIIVDSSRVALSLQVINKDGHPEPPVINPSFEGNQQISVEGDNGEYTYKMSYRMDSGKDYNSLQVSISDEPELEKVTIKFNLLELNGKQGNWNLEIPVEITDHIDKTKTISLKNAIYDIKGVSINLKEIQYAPTSNTLLYETSYQTSKREEIEEYLNSMRKEFGLDISDFTFGTAIRYFIENEEKKVMLNFSPFLPHDEKLIMSNTQMKEELGHLSWQENFVPERIDSKLTFVLEGVYEVVPTDFSVKFNPQTIKDNPVTFKYLGNEISIQKAQLKSVTNQSDQSIFEIEMEVRKESGAAELGIWALKDNTGKTFRMDNETTKKGEENYKQSLYFNTNGSDKTPQEMSLHLLSATNYYELEDKWRIPLYEIKE